MKRTIIVTIFCSMISLFGYSQDSSSTRENAIVFTKTEVEATFPGGRSGWIQFLENNLNPNVPVKNKAPKGNYLVIVRFIVSKDGSISEINPESRHGHGMEEEVIRVMKRSPNWISAKQNGISVNAYRRQQITFVVGK